MSYPIDNLVPKTAYEFDPIGVIAASTSGPEFKKQIENQLIESAQNPLLSQHMLYDFMFSTEQATQLGIFAPMEIMGPRRAIKVEDIKPGMRNVGHINHRNGQTCIYIFKDVITDVKKVDGSLHIHSNEYVVRDTSITQWFVQHTWQWTEVTKATSPSGSERLIPAEGDAIKGDIMLAINLSPIKPKMNLFKLDDDSIDMTLAHEGRGAVYYLSPRLETPRLSDEPIPPMPGMPQPTPQPVEESPDDGKPAASSGPAIPPMPGENPGWEKPETKDWWIS